MPKKVHGDKLMMSQITGFASRVTAWKVNRRAIGVD